MLNRNKTIPSFEKFCNENKLILSNKDITDEDIGELLVFLNSHKSITYLDLSINPITCKGVIELAKNKNITVLDLSWTLVGNKGAEALAENNTLEILDLSCNISMDNRGINAFLKNNTLLALYMRNMLDVEGMLPPKVTAWNKNIVTTKIQQNRQNYNTKNLYKKAMLQQYFPTVLCDLIHQYLKPQEEKERGFSRVRTHAGLMLFDLYQKNKLELIQQKAQALLTDSEMLIEESKKVSVCKIL